MNNIRQIKFDGMTVNERLYVAGILDEYEAAKKERDLNKLRLILTEVELDEASVEKIISSL